MTPTFPDMAAGYRNMWRDMTVTRAAECEAAARRILAGRARYQAVERQTGVPWFFIGLLHMRESSCNFAGVLHNGEHIIGKGTRTRLGAISSVLGVAGGEVIIPTLVFGYGVLVKDAGSLSMLISLPTVLAGLVRHARTGAFADRSITATVIVPIGAGSIVGAIVGGLLVGYVPANIIKVGLGILLVWSAWKVFGR